MNERLPTPDSRLGYLRARRDALHPAHAQATADLAKADKAAAALRTERRRPPRALRRQAQRDRDRLQTRLTAIETKLRQAEGDLAALQERLAVVRAELAQLDQRDHPVTAEMTIAHCSERFFALRRELRDLAGGEPAVEG